MPYNGEPDTQVQRQMVGTAIRRARVGAGLSQRDLANLSGLNQSTICRLERGKLGGMHYQTLMRVLRALGIREIRIVATPWFYRGG